MGNAPKFTESGEIELTLDIEEEKDDRIKLHVTIRDTGIGIPKAKLSTIFLPFQQADGSTTRKYGGTGLGLSICKQLAGLMGGDVWAESPANCQLKIEDCQPEDISKLQNNSQSSIVNNQSKTGPGSIFHFTAWLGKSEEKEVRRLRPVSLSGKRALIVDDNRTSLGLLTQLLELVGMDVVALINGEKVITTLQNAIRAENPFALCIMDIQMPGMNATKAIRKWERLKDDADDKGKMTNDVSIATHVPIVAMTANALKGHKEKCLESGMDDYITKPIKREQGDMDTPSL